MNATQYNVVITDRVFNTTRTEGPMAVEAAQARACELHGKAGIDTTIRPA